MNTDTTNGITRKGFLARAVAAIAAALGIAALRPQSATAAYVTGYGYWYCLTSCISKIGGGYYNMRHTVYWSDGRRTYEYGYDNNKCGNC